MSVATSGREPGSERDRPTPAYGTDENGDRVYYVSDPDPAHNGEPRVMSQDEFDNRYNENAIVIIPEE